MFAEIRSRVRQGRWALAGGWWIEPDCNLPNGESLVRQGLYGQRYFRSRFGRQCRTGTASIPSVTPPPAQAPRRMRPGGVRLHAAAAAREPRHTEPRLPLARDDGTEVTAIRIPRTYGVWSSADLEREIGHAVELARTTPLNDESFAFYGVGNHGGGPTKEMLAAVAAGSRSRSGRAWPTRPGPVARTGSGAVAPGLAGRAAAPRADATPRSAPSRP